MTTPPTTEIDQARKDLADDLVAVRNALKELALRALIGVGVALGLYVAYRLIRGIAWPQSGRREGTA